VPRPNALDYILKPVDEKELIEALLKVAEKKSRKTANIFYGHFFPTLPGRNQMVKKLF